MSLTAEAMEYLASKGLSLAEVIEFTRITEQRKDPTAGVRQQRRRDKLKAERDASRRDVTRDEVSPNESILTPSGTDSPDEASASSPSRQPVAAAIEVWNDTAAIAGWPTVSKVSANRSKSTSARLREHGLDGWSAAIGRARASPYLGGSDPPSWFTFDWLIKSGNFIKLIEGNYDHNRSGTNGNRPSGWQTAYHANIGQGGP